MPSVFSFSVKIPMRRQIASAVAWVDRHMMVQNVHHLQHLEIGMVLEGLFRNLVLQNERNEPLKKSKKLFQKK